MNTSMLTERLRRRGLWLFTLLVAAGLTLSACDLVGDDSDDEQQQQAQQEEVQEEAAAAPAPAARPAAQPPAEEPGPEPPPEAAGGGEGAKAYSIVFPSIAFVMTADSVATGLVTSDGFVLVDGGALGGAMMADVLLSNGETLEGLPVVGHDRFTGLAYLGPLDGNLVRRLPGARLGDGEGIRPGSSVFTIGYSADDQLEAIPAVYSGVLSGTDEWDAGQRTFLRTDARPANVTAGMILVDGSGTVIGFGGDGMVTQGWYVSTGDLARALPPTVIAAARMPDPASASTEHVLTIDERQGSGGLYFGEDATDQSISLSISTMTPALLELIDANGAVLQESLVVAGSTIISLAPNTVGPYFLQITPQMAMAEDDSEAMESTEGEDGEQREEDMSEAMALGATYEISSSAPMMSLAEMDEMSPLQINTPLVGTIDIPGDEDSFNVALRGGAEYQILVQSLLFDTVLLVEGSGLDAVDDDTGGGPFGRDSALTLAPETDSIVQVTVKDYADRGTGAYVLTITQVGGEVREDAMAMEEEEEAAGAMAMAAELPAPSPPPAVSLRGIGTEEGLQATLLGIGSQSVGNALVVDDADGSFEITVSVVGRDGALGRVSVLNIGDEVVVEGRVLVTCGGSGSCLAQAIFVANEAGAGVWTVELSADEPGISEWQIEVVRND